MSRVPPIWLKGLAFWAALIALLYCLSGCSTPGGAGFRELARSNARERTALKAVAIHAENIGKHVDRAQVAVGRLAKSSLTKEQAADLAEIKVQLQQVIQERDALTQSLLLANREVEARDALIAQTKEAARQAASEAFWAKVRFSIYALLFGFVAGGVVTFLFRATLHGAIIATRAYLRI